MDFDYSTYSLAPNAESRQPSPAREKPITENYLRKTWIERCIKNCRDTNLRNEQVVGYNIFVVNRLGVGIKFANIIASWILDPEVLQIRKKFPHSQKADK